MSAIDKLHERIKQKGLLHTLQTLWKRYVFFHRELLWLGRDLVTPVAPHKLRPYTGLRLVHHHPGKRHGFHQVLR